MFFSNFLNYCRDLNERRLRKNELTRRCNEYLLNKYGYIATHLDPEEHWRIKQEMSEAMEAEHRAELAKLYIQHGPEKLTQRQLETLEEDPKELEEARNNWKLNLAIKYKSNPRGLTEGEMRVLKQVRQNHELNPEALNLFERHQVMPAIISAETQTQTSCHEAKVYLKLEYEFKTSSDGYDKLFTKLTMPSNAGPSSIFISRPEDTRVRQIEEQLSQGNYSQVISLANEALITFGRRFDVFFFKALATDRLDKDVNDNNTIERNMFYQEALNDLKRDSVKISNKKEITTHIQICMAEFAIRYKQHARALEILDNCEHQCLKVNMLKVAIRQELENYEGYEKAVDWVNRCVHQGNKNLLLERGKIYYRNKKYSEALDDCQNFIAACVYSKAHLNLGHVYNLKGKCFYKLDQMVKALEFFDKAIAAGVSCHGNKAKVYLLLKAYELCIEQADLALHNNEAGKTYYMYNRAVAVELLKSER